jgi:hypothetical protein
VRLQRVDRAGGGSLQLTRATHRDVLVARPAAAAEWRPVEADIIAPGQDILAAVAPPNNFGRDFDLYSGTSMSSPHVRHRGVVQGAAPDWSPMAIKSALMTTATDIIDFPGSRRTQR